MKKEWKHGWKVCCITSDRKPALLISAIASFPYAVAYEQSKTTKRPRSGGPLTAFDTKNNAINFLNQNTRTGQRLKIVKCEYIQSIDRILWLSSYSRIEKIYNFPTGTKFADQIRLV